MQTHENEASATSTGNTSNTTSLKNQKFRPPKATRAQAVGFPNVKLEARKEQGQGPMYSLCIYFPVTGSFGTATEAGQVNGFAGGLDGQATTGNIGRVTSVNYANCSAEVVLTLTTTVETQTDHAAPARNAFTQLSDFLSSAPALIQGPTGTPASYKVKVNGSTILVGNF